MTSNSRPNCAAILKDVVAYVDVWSSSKTENYSKPFIQQLQDMGVEVSKTFNKQVTHVVFKNGHQATWNKAKKTGVKLVSVLWVARCKDDGEHVNEELCPALNDEVNPALKKRVHRCMQPRDTPQRTPENDRRLKKKLDKMIKDLVPKSPLITDVSPYIIDEENGIVYSPSMKRSESMAQRLKEMREKRENLSPTVVGRGTAYAATAGVTDTISDNLSKQKGQVNVVEKSMDKNTKTLRTLVMTSMPTEKQHTVTQVVRALGGFSVVAQVCESTTHVVSGGHRRTLNILLGIARGCWILSFEWILWCLEQRQWIPEEPYELSDQFPAASICRLQQHLSAGEHQQDLFLGQPAMFVSRNTQPPTHSLVELIQLCGGTVCKTVRQTGLCIGEYNGKRPEGSRILSEQWVLDCITHLKQLPYEKYDLEWKSR
ncbi:microcephalin isoform X3 [Oncorhynchus mykiss]|uniref:Microcephalin 1 n=1 Tax=Oncorhynchus mykiss TaxID=8022 RepID=A0A8C7TDV5_ONCMY|nr:microcephalin isoform X3 [Oncorhynchus mykiss]